MVGRLAIQNILPGCERWRFYRCHGFRRTDKRGRFDLIGSLFSASARCGFGRQLRRRCWSDIAERGRCKPWAVDCIEENSKSEISNDETHLIENEKIRISASVSAQQPNAICIRRGLDSRRIARQNRSQRKSGRSFDEKSASANIPEVFVTTEKLPPQYLDQPVNQQQPVEASAGGQADQSCDEQFLPWLGSVHAQDQFLAAFRTSRSLQVSQVIAALRAGLIVVVEKRGQQR